MTRRKRCQVCNRLEGSTKNMIGEEDGIPLGKVEKCPTCGRWACPDCLHEADCCFVEADEHAAEECWCPPGWRIASGEIFPRLEGTAPCGTTFERIDP